MGWFPLKKALMARSIYLQSGTWPGWASWRFIIWVKAVFGIS